MEEANIPTSFVVQLLQYFTNDLPYGLNSFDIVFGLCIVLL